MSAGEKTSEAYWSGLWSHGTLPTPIDVGDRRLNNHGNVVRHRYFCTALAGVPRGAALLEIGAAQSRWLPYFHRQFGYEVTGLDYSQVGCERAKAVLDAATVPGDVVCADLFDPPSELRGKFDIVVSFGVVEHFDDTSSCLAACSDYVKPGGRVITTVPNMAGGLGHLQRWANPDIYAAHVPLTAAELAAAHAKAGLDVVASGYFLSANWRAVALGQRQSGRGARLLRHGLSVITKVMWQAERLGLGLPPNRLTSPYVFCTAIKPAPDASQQQAIDSR